MMSKKKRILIVEDEEAISRGLADVFIYHGYDVEVVADGKEGLERAQRRSYDLIILDVMLPTLDGYSICAEIRKADRVQPIVMLTAKGGEDDIVNGLALGADDYVTKPFSIRELVLRVEAILRRTDPFHDGDVQLQVGSLTIDTLNLVGRTGDSNVVEFTRKEVEILKYLRIHGHRPVSRDELLTEIWGYAKSSSIETRTVDIHITKIRRKIEPDPKFPEFLITVRGEGYKLL